MKQIGKIAIAALLLLALILPLAPITQAASSTATTPTGYNSAADVEYVVINGTVVNWGAREEDCTFLSSYAESYYVGSYAWETLSTKEGGTGIHDAYNSPLYRSLQSMMRTKHTNIQSYQETRPYYCYTDCVSNDYSKVCSFYSGKLVNGVWDSGKTYNREHVWPSSKCINTSKAQDGADIMTLRATISSENGSRGNKAYGLSGGYFTPDEDVRGDCARMLLYTYVRWGNTNKMWGTSGVIESLDILLQWMEADPVDTWEMGRNDSVQSITGVRNVFVDYPEYAWMIFGQQIPEGLVTPSGQTVPQCDHSQTEKRNQKDATCGKPGYTGDTYCADCGEKLSSGSSISATGRHTFGNWTTTKEPTEEDFGEQKRICSVCGRTETAQLPKLEAPACPHETTELRDVKDVTCAKDGYTGDLYCIDCELLLHSGEVLTATGNHIYGDWIIDREATGSQTGERHRQCSECDFIETEEIPTCKHPNTALRNQKDATCAQPGHTGETYCADCGDLVDQGSAIRATGKHVYGEWVETEEGAKRTCSVCNHSETVLHAQEPATDNSWVWIVIAAAAATTVVVSVVVIVIIRKKRK